MKATRAPAKLSIWYWLVGGVAASVALTALVIWLVDPRYLFNDDMIIASILSGDYTGTANPKSIYGGPGVSLLIVSLSGALPGVPWFLALCIWCTVTLLLLLGIFLFRQIRLTGPSSSVIALPLVAIQGTLAIWALPLPSYSAAAVAAGAGSLILLFIYLQSRPAHLEVAVLLAVSVTLFATGWGLREGGFPILGLFAASLPVVLLLLWNLRWVKAGLLIALWLIVVAVDRTAKRFIYVDEGWVESLAVVDRLNMIWSGYVFGSIIPIGLAQGWSGAEVGLIQYLSPVPSASFTLESLDNFLDAAQINVMGSWAIAPPTWGLLANTLSANKHAFLVIGFISLILMIFLIASRERNLKVWIFSLGGIASVSGVIIFLGAIRNNTAHVSLPLTVGAMTLLAMAVLLLTKRNMELFRTKVAIASASILCLGFLYISWNLDFGAGTAVKSLNAKKASWALQSDEFRTLDPACVILGVNLGAENAPARNATELYGTFPLVQLTWNALTPHTDARLALLGEKSWGSLFGDTSCTYFFGSAEHAEMVAEVSRQQHGAKGTFEPVLFDGSQLPEVWQWQGN